MILFASDGRIHLESAVFLQILVTEQQVMGRGLAAHIKAPCLRLCNQLHAFLRGNMADVIFAARLFHQTQVCLNGPPFAFGGNALVPLFSRITALVYVSALSQGKILAVGCNGQVQLSRNAHRFFHERRVVQPCSVIAESDYVWRHCFQIRKFSPFFAYGNRTVGANIHKGVSCNPCSLYIQILQAVRHGIEVRHGKNMSVARCRRRFCPGQNRLFIGKSRLSQMYMDIYKRWDFKKLALFHCRSSAFSQNKKPAVSAGLKSRCRKQKPEGKCPCHCFFSISMSTLPTSLYRA